MAGIVFLGGLARGFADRFSDVDVTVFLEERNVRLQRQISRLGREEGRRSGVDVDLMVLFTGDWRKSKPSEEERWEYSHARVVFDPEGKAKRLLDEVVMPPRMLWVRRIAICVEYLKWYACPDKLSEGTMSDAWLSRGDLVSAHYCLSYAVDVLVKLVYALNKELLPAAKWRLFYSYGLKWLPPGYEKLLKEALMVRELSEDEFRRRSAVLRKMCESAIAKACSVTGLSAEELSRYFMERILRQTWHR